MMRSEAKESYDCTGTHYPVVSFLYEPHVILGPGVHAPDVPVQEYLSGVEPIVHGQYRITPLASFELSAKVLSRENYYLGREADLSPTDLAMGWGRMSDESVIKQIDISQSNRWYYWQAGAH